MAEGFKQPQRESESTTDNDKRLSMSKHEASIDSAVDDVDGGASMTSESSHTVGLGENWSVVCETQTSATRMIINLESRPILLRRPGARLAIRLWVMICRSSSYQGH